MWLRLNLPNQFPKALQPVLLHQLIKPTRHEILLVVAQKNAATLFQEHSKLIELQIN